MKVLEKGLGKEFICTGKGSLDTGCGAKLLVEKMDIKEKEGWCLDDYYHHRYFICPLCKTHTHIDKF